MLPLLWFPSCHISRPSGRLFRYQVMRQCDKMSLGKGTSPRDAVAFVCAPMMASCLKTSDTKDTIIEPFVC